LVFFKEIAFKNDFFDINRNYRLNEFEVVKSKSKFREIEIPFITNGYNAATFLLNDILKTDVQLKLTSKAQFSAQASVIHSQPTDSLLKPMMHNSDNFFAEQTLLMVSNEKLGVMSDEKIIDTLLKTDFKGLPQKPRWVDGSGLSRYNLITPQDFVWVLNKMKADFSWQRITTILATGNEGTLNNYYKNLSGSIFAKTGTLSGQVALSGYLITKQGKSLVFSVLVNNHQTSATAIRRGVEKFLTQVYEQY
jgi:D-alanyl-D-alanine carboxypeptidase/D-alanyl-D-alanine-endopeptidase (penicillin-binding protein 4)